jgi:hypothetical protein
VLIDCPRAEAVPVRRGESMARSTAQRGDKREGNEQRTATAKGEQVTHSQLEAGTLARRTRSGQARGARPERLTKASPSRAGKDGQQRTAGTAARCCLPGLEVLAFPTGR